MTSQTGELAYGGVYHQIPVYTDITIDLSASYVEAHPGSTLSPSDISSEVVDISAALKYQIIRQRQENLVASLKLAGRNSNGDILGDNPLTRDRIRTLSIDLSYDTSDTWDGYNYLTGSVTQGIDILGSNDKGDANLSRANADPSFTRLNLSYLRQQAISDDVVMSTSLAGQIASAPLASSEEFGYGGQRFGRAYDPSEIIGDQGVAASVELQYYGLPYVSNTLQTVPYAFYDIGRVWNKGAIGNTISASSVGVGTRFTHDIATTADIAVAWPLTKPVDNPITGHEKNPRFIFRLGYKF